MQSLDQLSSLREAFSLAEATKQSYALPKISKTTPCKAAGVPPALGKALDASGNSVAHFHYSEIAQPPAAAQWLAHLAEGQIDPLAAEHAVLAVGKRRHTVIK